MSGSQCANAATRKQAILASGVATSAPKEFAACVYAEHAPVLNRHRGRNERKPRERRRGEANDTARNSAEDGNMRPEFRATVANILPAVCRRSVETMARGVLHN